MLDDDDDSEEEEEGHEGHESEGGHKGAVDHHKEAPRRVAVGLRVSAADINTSAHCAADDGTAVRARPQL